MNTTATDDFRSDNRAITPPACPGSATAGNAVRGRLNAAVLRTSDACGHLLLGRCKRRLFANLPPIVVEIGPGTGANLRYYRPGTRLIAIEPNRHMHSPLRKAALRYGIEVELREEGADAIGLPPRSPSPSSKPGTAGAWAPNCSLSCPFVPARQASAVSPGWPQLTTWRSRRRPVPGPWRLRKSKTLVKLLALAGGHRAHRDVLAGVLWPGLDPAAAANNLHQVLHAARRALASDRLPSPGALCLRDDIVILWPDGDLIVDADVFAAAAQRALRSGSVEDYGAA